MTAVNLGGIYTSTGSRSELVDQAVKDCQGFGGQAKLVFDLNGHGLASYYTSKTFRNHMDQADIVHADGGFIVALSKWLTGVKIVERSATTDLIHDIARRAEIEGLSFYLLGGTEQASNGAVRALKATYPKLKIAGWRHGYFSEGEEDDFIDAICTSAPDILWVGLGKPKEQAFALKCKGRVAAGWVVTCGGCFDFLAVNRKRAPVWMRKLAIEWVFRLILEPRRLFWRYFWSNPYALYLIIRYSSKIVRET